MGLHRFQVLACGWLLIAATASAQPTEPLTLDAAIARAVDVSQRLDEVRARGQGARAAADLRRIADLPTFEVSAGYARTNHVQEFTVPQPGGGTRTLYPDLPNNYYSRLVVQWPIYTGGRTDALQRAAEAEVRAVGAELEAARADLRLEVVRAYWALVTANESLRVIESGLARAAAHLRDVRSRFEQGLIPPNEVSTVEAQHARQEMLVIEAQNVRNSVQEDLRRLTGVAGDIVPADALGSAAASSAEIEPVTTALDRRPERTALRDRIAAAEQRVDAAAAGRRPAIGVRGAFDYANPNPRIFPRHGAWQESWELSVNVSWQPWDWGRTRSETAEADAAASALRARLADLEAAIATDVRQRLLDLDSARAALTAAEQGVRSADEARRVVAERFAVGVATSTDVLDAQLLLLQAQLDRTRSLASVRLAEARFNRAMGR